MLLLHFFYDWLIVNDLPTIAGILPNLSAIHPKISPPKIDPQKKTACVVAGYSSLSHTHPSCECKMELFYSKLASKAIKQY